LSVAGLLSFKLLTAAGFEVFFTRSFPLLVPEYGHTIFPTPIAWFPACDIFHAQIANRRDFEKD
jgi:hypothetical protein